MPNYDPNDPTNKAELEEYHRRENARTLPKKVEDEVEQVSNRSDVFIGSIGVVIATLFIGLIAFAAHGCQ